MSFTRKFLWTLLYLPLYAAYLSVRSNIDGTVCDPWFTIPLPYTAGALVSLENIFVIIAVIILGIELSRSTHFQPNTNKKDALLSILLAGLYLILFLLVPYFQDGKFIELLAFTAIDAFVGFLAINGISLRSVDVVDRNSTII